MKIAGQRESVRMGNIADEMMDCSRDLMAAIDKLEEDAKDWAEKDWIASRDKAIATVKYKDSGKSADIRDAFAKKEYLEQEKEANLAKELKVAQLERVRALRQKLSALQTRVNNNKAEIEAFGYGQTEG